MTGRIFSYVWSFIIGVLVFGVIGGPLGAQEGRVFPDIVVVDYDRMARESLLAKAMLAEIDGLKTEWQREADQMFSNLEKEEQDLSDLRPTVSSEEFAKKAAEFDERVQSVRRERAGRAQSLEQMERGMPSVFRSNVKPVLQSLLAEIGATAILSVTQFDVFAPQADVTDLAIARVDKAFLELQETQAQPSNP